MKPSSRVRTSPPEQYPVQRQRSRVRLAELHVTGAVSAVGAMPELGVDDRLVLAELAPDRLGVAVVLDLRVPVVVDADDVEQAPVDYLERDRGIGERPVERRANPLARFGEVRLERPGIGAGSRPAVRMLATRWPTERPGTIPG